MNEEAQRLGAADERTLFGACLQDAAVAVEALALVPASDLVSPQHRALHALLSERIRRGEGVDLAAVSMAVHEQGARRFGGVAYVAELPEHCPSSRVDIRDLAERIRDRAMRRTLGDIGRALLAASQGERVKLGETVIDGSADEIAAATAMHLASVARPNERAVWMLHESMERAIERRREQRASHRPLAVPTCSAELDDLLDGGLRPGELIVVAGRPGAGKTSYALGLAADAARTAGAQVGVISLEMDDTELADKVLSRASGMPLSRLRRGEVDDDQLVVDWRAYAGEWCVQTAAPPTITMAGIVAQAQRWKAVGLDLLIIDYLQLIDHGRADRQDLAVGATSRACKALARQLRIPVVLLSQLNREVEKRAQGRKAQPREGGAWWDDCPLPQPSDLRDSGQIEQDADVILFPCRAEPYGVLDANEMLDRTSACVSVAKNRNGRTGVVAATWVGHTASYANPEPSDLL